MSHIRMGLPSARRCQAAGEWSAVTRRGRVDLHVELGKVYWQEVYGSLILAAAVEMAGLPEGTTRHDLRHHYASVLLAAGESVVAVAERLGHENATSVLSTYGHPDAGHRRPHPAGRR